MKKQAITLLLILTGFVTTYAQSYPEMITVEGGTFTMGDTDLEGEKDEQPTHQVTLNTYKIAKTETTVAQWRAFCSDTGRAMPQGKVGGWINNHPIIVGSWIDNHPIINVNYEDAIAYCSWLSEKLGANYQLPTEAEWEYAARGGKLSKGTKYSGGKKINNVGWCDSKQETQSVATKRANELGIFDMSGNVLEWCKDWYGDYSAAAQTNPQGPSNGTGRVTRGGSRCCWTFNCRVSRRYSHEPNNRGEHLGFRVVLSQ
jgi:sulfatase modifying factor 1